MLHNERGQEVDPNYVNCFPEKILVCGIWAILDPKLIHTSGSALSRPGFPWWWDIGDPPSEENFGKSSHQDQNPPTDGKLSGEIIL